MKTLINVAVYGVVIVGAPALMIWIWQLAWNLVMPLFGLPTITFMQGVAMWIMAVMVIFILPTMYKNVNKG